MFLGLLVGLAFGVPWGYRNADKILDQLQDPDSVTRATLDEAGYQLREALEQGREVLHETFVEIEEAFRESRQMGRNPLFSRSAREEVLRRAHDAQPTGFE